LFLGAREIASFGCSAIARSLKSIYVHQSIKLATVRANVDTELLSWRAKRSQTVSKSRIVAFPSTVLHSSLIFCYLRQVLLTSTEHPASVWSLLGGQRAPRERRGSSVLWPC